MRNLIVLRCGRNSLHWEWLKLIDRNWDIVLCPYETINTYDMSASVIQGQKWEGLAEFFRRSDVWRNYEYICLPDDDLNTDAATWNAFFNYCALHKAHLAAPALTENSYFSHPITMRNQEFQARKTSFVEIMAPCFSRSFFEHVLPTFGLSRSGTGFGLDFLWPHMLGYQDTWIFDATAVHHTRPVGQMRNKYLASLARADLGFVRGFGITAAAKTLVGLIGEQEFRSDSGADFADRYRAGYAYLADRSPGYADYELSLPFPKTNPEVDARVAFALHHISEPDRTISRGRPSETSSVSEWSWSQDPKLEASGANDGLLNGLCGFHTAYESNPWWQVDFGSLHRIDSIKIYNRLDIPNRCIDFSILVSDDEENWRNVCAKCDGIPFGGADGAPYSHDFIDKPIARFLRVQHAGTNFLHFDQVEVFGVPVAGEGMGVVDATPNPAPLIGHRPGEVDNSPAGIAMRFAAMLAEPAGQELFAQAVDNVVTRRILGRHTDSYNIDMLASLAAGIDSAQFATAHMTGARRASSVGDLLDFAIDQSAPAGLILEFGVFSGKSINHIASRVPDRQVFGFDSFEGLPESWRPGFGKGTFKRTDLPPVARNVELVVGWFNEMLPGFVADHRSESIALLHVDCDLYSSTQTIFNELGKQIIAGTIIVFDEYFNYPGWQAHEHLAFMAFVAARGVKFEYIGLVPRHQQVAVRIISIDAG